jgi:hypothetical protein
MTRGCHFPKDAILTRVRWYPQSCVGSGWPEVGGGGETAGVVRSPALEYGETAISDIGSLR